MKQSKFRCNHNPWCITQNISDWTCFECRLDGLATFGYTHNLWDITQNASAERRFELKSAAGWDLWWESMSKLGVSPMLDPYLRLRVLDN